MHKFCLGARYQKFSTGETKWLGDLKSNNTAATEQPSESV